LSQARDVRIERPFNDKDDLSTGSLFLDEKLILEESLDLVMIRLEDKIARRRFV